MAKFNKYTQKATPEDNDTLMIYDDTSKANKLSPFSGIWNWMVGKLTNAVIANLQTNNKTVLGAINELNSNSFLLSSPTTTLESVDLDTVIKPGQYIISANDTCTNVPPILSRGVLIVSLPSISDYPRQIYLGGYSDTIYTRIRYYDNSLSNFKWTVWRKI